MPDPIRVLLVDDSAVIRGILARLIETDPEIEIVGSVSNGQMGVSSAEKNKPDIVILDIEMPVMDGLTALPEILKVSPKSKVIMFSTLTEKGATITLKAFELGAVECMAKPTSAQNVGKDPGFKNELIHTIKGLTSRQHIPAPTPNKTSQPITTALKPRPPGDSSYTLYNDALSFKGKPALLAIGSSTGGPQALFKVISHFKNFDIPIVVTQHMPPTFTKILAEHITQQTGVPASEGAGGMVLEKGHVYVAPGGRHMHLLKEGIQTVIHLDDGPPENFCKPSVDPMFRTAIDIFGNRVLGVILTGMGHDGLGGGRVLVEKGGRLIAQDEKTSVVWGMPGAVAQDGLCSAVLPLDEIGPWVKQAVIG